MKFFINILICLLTISISSLNAQWVPTNFPNGFWTYAFAVSGTDLFAGTTGGVFLTTDDGISWTELNNGLNGAEVNAFVSSGTTFFAGTNIGVFRSTNNGISWTSGNIGLNNTYINTLAVYGVNLFAGTGGGGIFRSTDGGTNWIAVNTDLTNTDVRKILVFDNYIFAGTGGGGIFLSTNSGVSWAPSNTGLPTSNIYILSLAVLGEILFAGTDYGVFHSTNSGANWTSANNGLNNNNVGAFAVSETNLFAATNIGVFYSTDGGNSWIAAYDNLAYIGITSLDVFGENLFAGGYGAVWKRPLSEMITAVESFSVYSPAYFRLEQNYPNPFNPSTKISWQSPVSSHQTIKVFDALGNELATLVNEEKPAGVYEVEFDASSLASGVYFYKLQAGSFVETKKMLLLK